MKKTASNRAKLPASEQEVESQLKKLIGLPVSQILHIWQTYIILKFGKLNTWTYFLPKTKTTEERSYYEFSLFCEMNWTIYGPKSIIISSDHDTETIHQVESLTLGIVEDIDFDLAKGILRVKFEGDKGIVMHRREFSDKSQWWFVLGVDETNTFYSWDNSLNQGWRLEKLIAPTGS